MAQREVSLAVHELEQELIKQGNNQELHALERVKAYVHMIDRHEEIDSLKGSVSEDLSLLREKPPFTFQKDSASVSQIEAQDLENDSGVVVQKIDSSLDLEKVNFWAVQIGKV